MTTEPTAFDRAVTAAGSLSALGRDLKISHQAISKFKRRGFFPPKRALEIEILYAIPAKELIDPDLQEMLHLLAG